MVDRLVLKVKTASRNDPTVVVVTPVAWVDRDFGLCFASLRAPAVDGEEQEKVAYFSRTGRLVGFAKDEYRSFESG
jgi:hypothetical protein